MWVLGVEPVSLVRDSERTGARFGSGMTAVEDVQRAS